MGLAPPVRNELPVLAPADSSLTGLNEGPKSWEVFLCLPRAKSDTTARLSGLSACHVEEPQGFLASEGDGVSHAPEYSQPVGLRAVWGVNVHLPFS